MSIRLPELAAVADEMRTRVVGARVQEVRQPTPDAVWLSLRLPGETRGLLLETRAGHACFLLSDRRPRTMTPCPAFAAKLRRDLDGARVTAVDLPWPDRVLRLRFAARDGERLLIAEASGHHANLFLTDAASVILLALKPTRSHKRTLDPGHTYTPPPPPESGRLGAPQSRLPPGVSPSEYLDRLVAADESADEVQALRTRVLAELARAAKRVGARARNLARDLDAARQLDVCRHQGELLKLHLREVRRGMESIAVPDVLSAEGGSATIPLRSDLAPHENLEWLFTRYKKGVRARPIIERRIRETAAEAQLLAGLTAQAEAADTGDALRELVEQGGRHVRGLSRTLTPERRSAPSPRHMPYRTFVSSAGRQILVGKGGRDNHELTFQVASPHDVWLHARGFAGSHAVIRLARGQEPDPETLLDAAHLAIHYSKAPQAGFCEVIWTFRRHVRPVPHGRPGEVLVQQDHNVAFDLDPVRVQRLLRAQEE